MKLLTNTIFALSILMLFTSCSRNTQINVEYEASMAVSEYNLSYLDESGEVINVRVNPDGADDVWHCSFMAEEGDMVYISGKYTDPNSALRLSIKIDGKIYKSGYSKGDTLKYLVVSGVVPYEE